MDNRHSVVWIDHTNAHVVHFNRTQPEGALIPHEDAPKHIHHKAGTMGSGHVYEDDRYLQDVANALRASKETLITGPGTVKWQLKAFLTSREPSVAAAIVGVEPLDHPSDNQLLALGRAFFRSPNRKSDPRLGMH